MINESFDLRAAFKRFQEWATQERPKIPYDESPENGYFISEDTWNRLREIGCLTISNCWYVGKVHNLTEIQQKNYWVLNGMKVILDPKCPESLLHD